MRFTVCRCNSPRLFYFNRRRMGGAGCMAYFLDTTNGHERTQAVVKENNYVGVVLYCA